MAKLYKVTIATGTKTVNVIAASEEEAKAKVPPVEGETVVVVTDEGEVVA